MDSLTFVDTNVWVYAHDRDETVKRDIARAFLANLSGVVISAQVMAEFHAVATRKLAPTLPPEAVALILADMATLDVQPITSDLVISAAALRQDHQLSPWDGLIIAAALAAGCTRIATEDLTDGAVIAGVRIENPFRAEG